MPEHVTGGIKYSNSATITLWGEKIKDTATEKVYADINIAAKTYAVELHKTCALTDKPLPGATFGLYNAQGGLIATGVTDINGKVMFQTNIVEGIILREHVLYYLQEVQAPPAYQLDDTQYWFCFCSDKTASCESCNQTMLDLEAVRIPFEQIGAVHVVNQPISCRLPATGGIGTHLYILSGLALVLAPFVYGFRLRRRYERRSKR